MSDDRGAASAPHFSPHTGRVKAAAILVIAGSFVGAAGSIIAGVEFAAATRRWLQEQNQPPAEVARVRLRQAFLAGQAATRAAADTWSHDGGRQEATSRP